MHKIPMLKNLGLGEKLSRVLFHIDRGELSIRLMKYSTIISTLKVKLFIYYLRVSI